MGKTYRKDKTFKAGKPRLNSHRDLPDYQHDLLDDEDLDYLDEEYYAKQICVKGEDVGRGQDQSSRKAD